MTQLVSKLPGLRRFSHNRIKKVLFYQFSPVFNFQFLLMRAAADYLGKNQIQSFDSSHIVDAFI